MRGVGGGDWLSGKEEWAARGRSRQRETERQGQKRRCRDTLYRDEQCRDLGTDLLQDRVVRPKDFLDGVGEWTDFFRHDPEGISRAALGVPGVLAPWIHHFPLGSAAVLGEAGEGPHLAGLLAEGLPEEADAMSILPVHKLTHRVPRLLHPCGHQTGPPLRR